jgi:FkbM family methyltransferase
MIPALKNPFLVSLLRFIGAYPQPPDFDVSRFPPLGRGDVAIDAGANIGRVTEIMARGGATVYAFEPNPHAFRVLSRRFKHWDNVHCLQKGAWDQPGAMPLYHHRQDLEDPVKWSTGSSLLENKSNIDPDRSTEVELIDMAEFIKDLDGRVALMKMDIEGAECRVLNKLLDTGIIDRIDALFVETHDAKMPELKPATDKIREEISRRGLKHVHLDWV